MQCRLPVWISEGQPQVAVDAHYICLVDERQREGFVPWNLVCVADNRQLLVVVTHFIGLKVNAVESAASNLPARVYVSNKFQIHNLLHFQILLFKENESKGCSSFRESFIRLVHEIASYLASENDYFQRSF